jgi:hypothetical protein
MEHFPVPASASHLVLDNQHFFFLCACKGILDLLCRIVLTLQIF